MLNSLLLILPKFLEESSLEFSEKLPLISNLVLVKLEMFMAILIKPLKSFPTNHPKMMPKRPFQSLPRPLNPSLWLWPYANNLKVLWKSFNTLSMTCITLKHLPTMSVLTLLSIMSKSKTLLNSPLLTLRLKTGKDSAFNSEPLPWTCSLPNPVSIPWSP